MSLCEPTDPQELFKPGCVFVAPSINRLRGGAAEVAVWGSRAGSQGSLHVCMYLWCVFLHQLGLKHQVV